MNRLQVRHFVVAAIGFFFFLATSASAQVCEPDNFAAGTPLTNACSGLTLLVEQRSDSVIAQIPHVTTATSTGTRVFGHTLNDDGWGSADANPETLRGNFLNAVRFVSIDLIGNDSSDAGFLRVYNSSNVLLAEVLSGTLTTNQVFTAMVSRPSADIAYFRASGIDITGDNLNLDNLRYSVPEPSTLLLLGIGAISLLGYRKAKSHS